MDRRRELVPAALAAGINVCVTGRSAWPLFAWGPPGTGKTRAALLLCDLVQGSCVYRDFGALCGEHADAKLGRLIWTGTNAETLPTPSEYWDWFSGASLAVIDEIGMRADATPHQHETLKAALDVREGVPMMLVSNTPVDGLAAIYGDPVASRIAAGTIVEVAGEDRRIRNRA